MLDRMRQLSLLFCCWAIPACATTEPPICEGSDLYVPIAVKQPRSSRQAAWVAVGIEVAPSGEVDRTYVIAERAPASFSGAALRSVKRWRFCRLPASQTALRVTHTCVYSALGGHDLVLLSEACERTIPEEQGHLE